MAVDFNNPANYKKCSKKNYEIYVCMPPENTVVINKLEQADVLRSMGGKEYYTATEIDNMSRHNPQKLQAIQSLVQQGKAYAVTKNTPFVLCGTVGEMWTISPQKLQATYTFVQNGQPLQINMQTLEQRKKNGVLDWTVVRTSASAVQGVNMACFVPKAQKGQIQTSWGAVLNINGVGVNHGLGDFIVCAMLPNGTPNLQDRWVVNGNVFATTYNNKGWENCINIALAGRGGVETIKTLPRLCPEVGNNVDKELYKKVDRWFSNYSLDESCAKMLELMRSHKFKDNHTLQVMRDMQIAVDHVGQMFEMGKSDVTLGRNGFPHLHFFMQSEEVSVHLYYEDGTHYAVAKSSDSKNPYNDGSRPYAYKSLEDLDDFISAIISGQIRRVW